MYILWILTFICSYCRVHVVAFAPISFTRPRATQQLLTTTTDQERNPSVSVGRISFVIPFNAADIPSKFGQRSPLGRPPSVLEVAEQLARKTTYFSDGQVQAELCLADPTDSRLLETDMLIGFYIRDEKEMRDLQHIMETRHATALDRQCQFAVDCESSERLPEFVGPFDPSELSIVVNVAPWSRQATAMRLYSQMKELFARCNGDDFVFAMMLFLNQFSGHSIDWVKYSIDATWEKGPVRNAKEFYDMVSQCGDCIAKCMADDTCRECIGKLAAVDTRDQVASYRTIVSYESDLLRDFSLCILTKHNVFGCDAKIPELPKVKPIDVFQGRPLSEDVARSILVGHLDDEIALPQAQKMDISWKVFCGANEAYDKFPSQNQLFYPAARGRDMWYDPVFRVETLDGRDVWCKRHYKVRPAETPGTFRLSVLDNGVTSNEFWTIVDVDDDLKWIVFHYAGAASAVGLRYLGGLLCTADGTMPEKSELPRIWEAFRKAGIEPWELYQVDNDNLSPSSIAAGKPPLDFFRAAVRDRQLQPQ